MRSINALSEFKEKRNVVGDILKALLAVQFLFKLYNSWGPPCKAHAMLLALYDFYNSAFNKFYLFSSFFVIIYANC